MSRHIRSLGVLVLVGTALAGCPASTTQPNEDAATVDAAARDAGTDGGGSAVDAAPGDDAAPAIDAGTDAAGSDAGPCSPACGVGRECCNGACIYTYNDPRNCGSCGRACSAAEICEGGSCIARPCTATCGSGLCCGEACCTTGQICCDPAGPVSRGPVCTDPDSNGTCPAGCAPLCVCASPDTMIATPSGERPIADLSVGDLVYTAQGSALVAVPLAAIHRTWVGGDHRMVRVTLETGRALEISPGHPTADGRFFSDLRAGELLDGARIVSVELVPYADDYTYDVLPASETATYVAGGVLIGSTMAPANAPVALAAAPTEP
jgi:hypothetical protein